MGDWILIKLEEYKTLREESLKALENQHSTLRLGALVAGPLFGGALTLWTWNQFAACLLLVFLSPLVIFLVSLDWVAEFGRMIRAGNYISVLEKEINAGIGRDILNYEQWLRTGGKQTRRYNVIPPLIGFFFLEFSSIVLGNFIRYTCRLPWWIVVSSTIIVIVLGFLHWRAYLILERIEKTFPLPRT